MARLPLDQAVVRFQGNDERMEIFVNGSDTDSFISSGGAVVPSLSNFLAQNDLSVGTQIHDAVAKVTPDDADEFPLADSAAAFVLKKLTFANF